MNGNGGGAAVYLTVDLPNVSLAAGDYYVVCANNATVANCDLDTTPETNLIQNGAPDAVALRFNTTIIDTVSYAGNTGAPYTEGSGVGLVDTAAAAVIESISRCPDGTDTNQNNVDFSLRTSTPGAANICTVTDAAPSVASNAPANGATGIAPAANIDITFSEPVDVSGSWFNITCATSGIRATVSGDRPGFTLNPDTDFATNETCSVTITASLVTDQDTNDPPNTMDADFSFSFTTAGVPICGAPATLIHDIQGTGLLSPLNGSSVTIEGIVIGDYQGAGKLSSYHVQEEDADADAIPATSEGIFVFNTSFPVNVGDKVRVSGTITEFGNAGVTLTELGNVTSATVCSSGNSASVTPVTASMPVTSLNDWERYESMLVSIPQDLTVTEHFTLGRFGEVSLSVNGRLYTPTNIVAPGAPALAQQDLNDRSRILLDDGNGQQNADPIRYPEPGGLSAANTLRTGYTVHTLTGVLEQRFDVYRVQPVGPISFDASTNPRPASSPAVGGSLRVVGMNLLNFFNTFGTTACNGGVGGAVMECRGADDAGEFARQWPKTVAAILVLNADIIGVNEIENDGYGPSSAIQFLVDRLNAATAPGTYAFIDVDAATGQTNAMGSDAIKVGMLYKPAGVTPVGQTAALNTVAFVNGGDPAPRARPSLAQAWQQNSSGARFILDINHFKSKGSACTAPDAGDGQGNCNQVRVNAATELVSWLAGNPTGTGESDILLLGDYNSYAMEDPITVIKNAGYTDLDSGILWPRGVLVCVRWPIGLPRPRARIGCDCPGGHGCRRLYHINADEPASLDYNDDFKSPARSPACTRPINSAFLITIQCSSA